MSSVLSETTVSVKTNRGNLSFPVFYIDADILPGASISIDSMSGGTPWYPLLTARSVWASPNRVYTEFESSGHAIKGVVENGDFFIYVFDEHGNELFKGSYGSLSGKCGAIGYTFFIGSNGVPSVIGLTSSFFLNPSEELPVIYTPNSNESFGAYARPNFVGLAGVSITESTISIANAILRDSSLEINDPYEQDPGGASGTGGGTGNFDGTGDTIDFPSLPSLSAVDTGFITLFNPSIAQLKDLANYLWGDMFDVSTWKKIFADPMDAILGMSIVPVAVPNGSVSEVTVGNIGTGVSMTKAAAQYVEIDCGTLNVKEYWGAYLDYDPYTKAEIYLPYVGTHPLAVDDIMNKPVHVKYHVDILSGSCCAYVKCGGSVMYSFVGQCSCSVPITGNDWTNVINGALSIAASIGTMVATGGASAPMAAATIASTAVNSMKPNVEKSGSMGGMGGMLGVQTPYLILTRPRQALPARQNTFMGYPSFITMSLGDCSGYTEIESVHLENIPATEQELSEIENLLKGGVIL